MIQGKARADIEVGGADKAAREFQKVGDSAKKAGSDIERTFAGLGRSIASFSANVVDAAVGFQGLDPKSMVASFFEYERQVTKTGLAVGQSVDQIRNKYAALARQNAVLPTQIDAFAKSVGRLTYDIKGAQDAFSAVHDAALTFAESDQDQVPFLVMLKNVMGGARDTEKEFGKLIAQADKLKTVGGPQALRDLFVALGPMIDQSISRLGTAREKAQAFVGVVTAGMRPDHARRVGSGILGALGSDPQGLKRTLGYDPFDQEGHLRDPMAALQGEYKYVRSRWYTDEARQVAAYEATYGMEAGRALFYALKRGKMGAVAGIAGIAPSNRASLAGRAYRSSKAGVADQKTTEFFLAGQSAVDPFSEWLNEINALSAKHPYLAAMVQGMANTDAGRAVAGVLVPAAIGSTMLMNKYAAPITEKAKAMDKKINPFLEFFGISPGQIRQRGNSGARPDQIAKAQAWGIDPADVVAFESMRGQPYPDPPPDRVKAQSADDARNNAKALAEELRNGAPIPMRIEGGPASSTTDDKNPETRN